MDPQTLLTPPRKITGISAILLPLLANNEVDWDSLRAHVLRTAQAGLTPAVNMDTGYVNLIDDATRLAVLDATRDVLGNQPFVAGAFVADTPGSSFDLDSYQARIDEIAARGATAVIFQSYGLTEQSDAAIVESYQRIGRGCDQFIGFELGQMFLPFGKIYSVDVYRQLVLLRQCIGAKHSSFNRQAEWDRLKLRNELRPDFKVFTGNDLAIDMVMYGSDYLLGLSTFAPDLFAKRDAYWAAGDPAFYELNDALQYLGFLTFRSPIPGYKHSAAMFLHLRGWIKTNNTYPGSPQRPDSDLPILRDVARLLDIQTVEA